MNDVRTGRLVADRLGSRRNTVAGDRLCATGPHGVASADKMAVQVAVSYRPIFDTSQLPPLGPLGEDLRFDMKMMAAEHFASRAVADLANDVAAFANTLGGVILVGANERPKDSGILHEYRPIPHSEAEAIGEVLKKALALCSPKPIAEAKLLRSPDGAGYIIAINCNPYTAPPIGVSRHEEKGGEKFWAFPARRGRETRNLRPEELATIMEPRLRRMLLLLDRIPTLLPEKHPRAIFHCITGVFHLNILSVDTEASSMHLIQMQDSREVVVPLEDIRMIWRDSVGGMYHVSLGGRLNPANVGFEFIPVCQ